MAKRNFLDRFGSDKQLMRVLKFIVKFNLFAIPLYLVLITGWKSMLALFALIMATDFRLKRKAFGMILIPVVFFINLLRILFMFFWVKTFDLAHYQTLHSLIWSCGLILTIVLLWFVWMKYDFLKIFDRNR